MLVPRENFAMVSGPDSSAGGATSVDSDPRVYAIGGLDINGEPLSSCEKYNPNTDTWTPIAPLPVALGNIDGSFVPDYGKGAQQTLGYIYVVGGGDPHLYRYNIRQDLWETFETPFAVSRASLQYLDDVGGPLAQLLIYAVDAQFPACSDGQSLWVVGGTGTERESWYIEGAIDGTLKGDWVRGPELPLKRINPVVGRTFWRDAGITSFGVSNCATIVVCGGEDDEGPTRNVQILLRKNCDWVWVDSSNNPSELPDNTLTLALPVANGAFGTEQWPETLVTGARPIVFGGTPPADFDTGSVQFAQFRFIQGRFRRDRNLCRRTKDSAWNTSTSMPGLRINLASAPISQANSSRFGGRRVSRFVCAGGRNSEGVLDRVQLFELPVPSAFSVLVERN